MTVFSSFLPFWSHSEWMTNIIIFLNLFGALLLGFVVGYERTYHGRAAGMRTYGLVCMASAALVVITGYPEYWFGARASIPLSVDPTRTIQGIVTGIGFLGAGVIMREGFNISGLTTAASLWASSAIGIMVGVGFYWAAILLALLSAVCMIWISKLETRLPSKQAVAITLSFRQGFVPREDVLRRVALERGYEIAGGTLAISVREGKAEWRFVAVALNRKLAWSLSALSNELATFPGVDFFQMTHARN
ncbi:MgtC/SapB family protein [Undibacterium sp.]|jgi:putative Mg2+ transporter-C (MgtC) family protein|uniref:MgtC/SapB family protein n=1 Tax=Undibacterium sp. TaxID=1914977 RepID=UPI002BA1837A|nr:MgtC/SapB family protein [Undibacterium sp.]HTD04962.1 MgtC/SapB family protein [Undibacterium sp.]